MKGLRLLLALLLSVFVLLGCSGGGGKEFSKLGRAVVKISWPEPGRVIPDGTQLIRVRFWAASTIPDETATSGWVGQVDIPVGTPQGSIELAQGDYIVRAVAYPGVPAPNAPEYEAGSIKPAARAASVPLRIIAGATAEGIDITLEKEASQVVISREGQTVVLDKIDIQRGKRAVLTATAFNSRGDVVLVGNFNWETSGADVVSFDGNSTASGSSVSIRGESTSGGGAKVKAKAVISASDLIALDSNEVTVSVKAPRRFGAIGVGLNLPGKPEHEWVGDIAPTDEPLTYNPVGLTLPSGQVWFTLGWSNASLYQGIDVDVTGSGGGFGGVANEGRASVTFEELGGASRTRSKTFSAIYQSFYLNDADERLFGPNPATPSPIRLEGVSESGTADNDQSPPRFSFRSDLPIHKIVSVAKVAAGETFAVSVDTRWLVGLHAHGVYDDGTGPLLRRVGYEIATISFGSGQFVYRPQVQNYRLVRDQSTFRWGRNVDGMSFNPNEFFPSGDNRRRIHILRKSGSNIEEVAEYLDDESVYPTGPMTISGAGNAYLAMSDGSIEQFGLPFTKGSGLQFFSPSGEVKKLRSSGGFIYAVLTTGRVLQIDESTRTLTADVTPVLSGAEGQVVDVGFAGDDVLFLTTGHKVVVTPNDLPGFRLLTLDLNVLGVTSTTDQRVEALAVGPEIDYDSGLTRGRPVYVLYNIEGRAGGVGHFVLRE